MPNVTPNYDLYLPLVNNVTDQDLWGGYLNSNFSVIDTLMATFEVPAVGKIEFFPFNAPPSGYLECNGSLVSRTTYPALWTAAQASGNIVVDASWDLGMFSTGDLTTTFRIPDYRGEFLRGWDNGKGTDSGRAIGTSQNDGVGPIGLNDPSHDHTFPSRNDGLSGGGSTIVNVGVEQFTQNTGSSVTGITITGTISETRPKNVAGMFCIKT